METIVSSIKIFCIREGLTCLFLIDCVFHLKYAIQATFYLLSLEQFLISIWYLTTVYQY